MLHQLVTLLSAGSIAEECTTVPKLIKSHHEYILNYCFLHTHQQGMYGGKGLVDDVLYCLQSILHIVPN
jgi:hypothetical protein